MGSQFITFFVHTYVHCVGPKIHCVKVVIRASQLKVWPFFAPFMILGANQVLICQRMTLLNKHDL